MSLLHLSGSTGSLRPLLILTSIRAPHGAKSLSLNIDEMFGFQDNPI